MRIDKYLWCVRLFKTRSLASSHARADKVLMDNTPLKPSREIRTGDDFVLKRHGYEQHFTVLALPKARLGAKLVADYLQENTPQAELDKREFLQLAKNMSRQKGLGRPTKKDRRDLDNLNF